MKQVIYLHLKEIYQSFDGEDVYQTIEEKAANFLYLIVKNHAFIDGNKRIAATLFIYFLHFYNILTIENKDVIDNNTLAALTILIAESNPKEKNIMIDLIMNILSTYTDLDIIDELKKIINNKDNKIINIISNNKMEEYIWKKK